MKDSVDNRRLAIVLKHANSSPPSGDLERKAFYELKSAICAQYGDPDGEDIQHIVKPCWGYGYMGCDDDCSKCGGSSIYSEKWVILQRWKIGGQVFHKPLRTVVGSFAPATIKGLIKHKPSKMAKACQRVLNTVFGFPAGYLPWPAYADAFALPDAEVRRFKAALTFLFGIDRRRWPGVRLRLPEMQESLRRYHADLIPF